VTLPGQPVITVGQKESKEIVPWVAIKTNLLFDAALAPNLEIEVPIGWSRWSVMAEWWTPWYRWRGENRHNRAYELLMLGGEVRYWFSHREAQYPRLLQGHFLGFYGAGGKYDFQWDSSGKHKGRQGEFTSFGLTYGYSAYLGSHWRMEFSASAGYVFGPRHYYNGMYNDTHLIWQEDKKLRYFGPTKLKVTISYLFGRRIIRKGGAL